MPVPTLSSVELDHLDKIRSMLETLRGSTKRELDREFAQIVVCGPQSTGKSSVLRRLSTIQFPTDATLCTRMPITLQLRRAVAGKPRSVTIWLKNKEGETILDKSYDNLDDNDDALTNGIKDAQERACKESTKDFVDDYILTVRVDSENVPDLTVVDLPGFHNANDEDARVVRNMVQEYITMPGSIVLHVVKGNQDYATSLGNDFMRQELPGSTRITVLTHCDVFSDDLETQLRNTLTETHQNSQYTVAVVGNVCDSGEEMQRLAQVKSLGLHLELGIDNLTERLRSCMHQHLQTQIPKMKSSIKKAMAELEATKERVKKKHGMNVVIGVADKIGTEWNQSRETLREGVAEIRDELRTGITKYTVRPPAGEDVEEKMDCDEFVEVGERVFWTYGRVEVEGEVVRVDGCSVTVKNLSDNTTCDKKIKEIKSIEIAQETVEQDIKFQLRGKGLKNVAFVDTHPILMRYTRAFAEDYTKKIEEAAQKIMMLVKKTLQGAFDSITDCMAKPVADKLSQGMFEKLEEIDTMMQKSIGDLREQNTHEDLIFTPNEHYFNDLVQKMMASDEGSPSDAAGVRHIVYKVRAFIKVQRKYVIEQASKQLVHNLVTRVDQALETLLKDDLPEFEHLVHEPPGREKEREDTEHDLQQIKKVSERLVELEKCVGAKQ